MLPRLSRRIYGYHDKKKAALFYKHGFDVATLSAPIDY